MDQHLEYAKKRLHYCMAAIGGCFGSYTVLRFGHFCSAVSVNLVEIFTGSAQGDWDKAILRLGSIALYAVILFLTAFLPKRVKSDLRLWAIWLDIAVMAVQALCAGLDDKERGVYLCLVAMAFQWPVFAGKKGYPCSTIFSTNNLRQFVDAWVETHLNKDSSHAPRMQIYGGTLLAFHSGVLVLCVLWRLGCGRWAILAALPPALLALRWRAIDLRIRERLGPVAET